MFSFFAAAAYGGLPALRTSSHHLFKTMGASDRHHLLLQRSFNVGRILMHGDGPGGKAKPADNAVLAI